MCLGAAGDMSAAHSSPQAGAAAAGRPEENPFTFAVGLQVSERAPFVVQKVGARLHAVPRPRSLPLARCVASDTGPVLTGAGARTPPQVTSVTDATGFLINGTIEAGDIVCEVDNATPASARDILFGAKDSVVKLTMVSASGSDFECSVIRNMPVRVWQRYHRTEVFFCACDCRCERESVRQRRGQVCAVCPDGVAALAAPRAHAEVFFVAPRLSLADPRRAISLLGCLSAWRPRPSFRSLQAPSRLECPSRLAFRRLETMPTALREWRNMTTQG